MGFRDRLVRWATALTPLGPDEFEVRHRPGGRLAARGRFPAAKAGALQAFFDRDLAAGGPIVVRGRVRGGRAVRIEVVGALSPAERQRARNFLFAHLG